ncbi:TetR/AcrR family transcriptional regulator [Silvibacterium dinghuense]|uniref:TetR/AcrR family transcriptional regulator n=1 Tax=Silvibacterium dinghuense TaxID=1560006 RepID=A0A4Q1SB41_9BACT|nr:TetR/AcrR family transcriptional regulator [Silvibacterium dinghuense]RXS94351.1 TetR/AcrR family transcriptional regulator [Silvibacterium dinghuense]
MRTIGRPRSQAAHDAILKATLRLITRSGFRAVSVNEIAAEAGVGKMTIYRHWPNKAAVVMDSLLELIGNETAFPKAGSALESLRRQLHLQAAFFRSARGNLIRSLVSEAQSDPELASAFRDRWLNPRREGVRQNIQAAISEGSLRRDFNIDTAIDQLYGSLYYRLLLGSGAIDDAFIEDTYQQFLAGHKARSSARK